jgi:flavin reductase (DIM6/NTAB) family NADH-FMN oxidoreductase RutF/DNA-binding IclR family transcriptional regulator
MSATPAFDQRELRAVLGTFVTGVTVVTTLDADGRPQGVTANSFSSVSLDPPLVLWSQALNARSYPAFRDCTHFVVNILSQHQIDVSQQFAKSHEEKFRGVKVRLSERGLPIIEGCMAFIECRKYATYPGGDHAVYLGEVERFERADTRPLAFGGGKYMVAHVHDLGSVALDAGVTSLDHAHAVQMANTALADIGARVDAALALVVWGNHGPTVIRWEPTRKPVVNDLRAGMVVSPLSSASGLAFCAHLPAPTIAPFIDAELEVLRTAEAAPMPTRADIDRQLTEIRTRGVAYSTPQRFGPDIAALSVPVFDYSGQMIMALTVADSVQRINADGPGSLQQLLREEARLLSTRLGHRQPAQADIA